MRPGIEQSRQLSYQRLPKPHRIKKGVVNLRPRLIREPIEKRHKSSEDNLGHGLNGLNLQALGEILPSTRFVGGQVPIPGPCALLGRVRLLLSKVASDFGEVDRKRV